MTEVQNVNASPELTGRLLALEFAVIGLMAVTPERERLLAALEYIALDAGKFITESPARKELALEAMRERIAFYVAASGGALGK